MTSDTLNAAPLLEGADAANTSHFELDALPKAPRTLAWSTRHAIDDRTYLAGVVGAAVAAGDMVFFSGPHGVTWAVDLASGRRRWVVHAPKGRNAAKGKIGGTSPEKTRDPDSGTLAVAGGTVFTAAGAGLYALDAETGRRRFAIAARRAVVAFPLVAHGLLFVADLRNGVFAFDAVTGKPRWQQPAGGGSTRAMAYADGRLVVGGRDGFVRALDAATGRPLWKAKGSYLAGASVSGEKVITSSKRSIVAYDLERGKRLAEVETQSHQVDGPFTCTGDRVVFYESEHVACADLAKEKIAWRTPVDLLPWSATDAKRTYIAGSGHPSEGVAREGELAAFDTKTGRRAWSVKSVGGWRCDPRVRPTPVPGGLLVALKPAGDLANALALVR